MYQFQFKISRLITYYKSKIVIPAYSCQNSIWCNLICVQAVYLSSASDKETFMTEYESWDYFVVRFLSQYEVFTVNFI